MEPGAQVHVIDRGPVLDPVPSSPDEHAVRKRSRCDDQMELGAESGAPNQARSAPLKEPERLAHPPQGHLDRVVHLGPSMRLVRWRAAGRLVLLCGHGSRGGQRHKGVFGRLRGVEGQQPLLGELEHRVRIAPRPPDLAGAARGGLGVGFRGTHDDEEVSGMRTAAVVTSLMLAAGCAAKESPRSAGPSGYLESSGRADRLSGGARRIPITTPKGSFEVWTKRVGNNPRIRVLLLHGGPGLTHEYLEAFDVPWEDWEDAEEHEAAAGRPR